MLHIFEEKSTYKAEAQEALWIAPSNGDDPFNDVIFALPIAAGISADPL
jgi:hypothetical protein